MISFHHVILIIIDGLQSASCKKGFYVIRRKISITPLILTLVSDPSYLCVTVNLGEILSQLTVGWFCLMGSDFLPTPFWLLGKRTTNFLF